jgi:hypothetical protein
MNLKSALGPSCCGCSRCPPRSFPPSSQQWRARTHPGRARPARRHSDYRCCRRSAGGAVRSGLLFCRRCQVHLRHGLLYRHEYRRSAHASRSGLLTTVAWQLGEGGAVYTPWRAVPSSAAPPCSGCATACRSSAGAGRRGAGRDGRGSRWRGVRTRAHRAGRAALGPGCPRADHRLPGERSAVTSPARRWMPWRCRTSIFFAAWSATWANACVRCGSMAAPRPMTAACRFRPITWAQAGAPAGARDHGGGASYLAGIGVGCGSAAELKRIWQPEREFAVELSAASPAAHGSWQKAVRQTLATDLTGRPCINAGHTQPERFQSAPVRERDAALRRHCQYVPPAGAGECQRSGYRAARRAPGLRYQQSRRVALRAAADPQPSRCWSVPMAWPPGRRPLILSRSPTPAMWP